MKQAKLTHEQFIKEVAALGLARLGEEEAGLIGKAKLTYGAGQRGLRGITYFNQWLTTEEEQTAFVEICSFGEENPVQLAGTTLHELGHVKAGFGAGHGKVWKCACGELGLRGIRAAGTSYQLAMFEPEVRMKVVELIGRLENAKPANGAQGGSRAVPKPCSMGIGTRGGKSRGVGSGSRLRKYTCQCGQIIRASTDSLEATHKPCGGLFQLA